MELLTIVSSLRRDVLSRAIKGVRLGLEVLGLLTVFYAAAYAFLDVNVTVKRKVAGVGTYVGAAPVASDQSPSDNHHPANQVEGATPAKGLVAAVLPAQLIVPVPWGNLGAKMVSAGVIDVNKFEALYAGRSGLGAYERELLYGSTARSVTVTPENAGTILNFLWAFGLANKSPVLEKGPISDPRYGGAGGFASTGGWTLAKGDAMAHFSQHAFVALTADQQQLVEQVSQGIFRPCCGNATYFPDCNHGMAMLGLLELMAANGASEEEMYRAALQVNAYWFPDAYLMAAQYFAQKGMAWGQVDPRQVLGPEFSSASGAERLRTEVGPVAPLGGGGCGV